MGKLETEWGLDDHVRRFVYRTRSEEVHPRAYASLGLERLGKTDNEIYDG